jgi:guanylate kinase
MEKVKQAGKLFLLMGPSGTGKDTLEKMLKQRHPNFLFPCSVTTRSPRPGEIAGENYYFVSQEQFEQYVHDNALLEWAVIHQTQRSGILARDVLDGLAAGKTVIRQVDVQGWQKILQNRAELRPRLISIFLLPPSLEILEQRIHKRAPITAEELKHRMESIQRELLFASQADYRVVSEENEQEKIYEQIEQIILQEMKK